MIKLYKEIYVTEDKDNYRLDLCCGDADMTVYYKIAESLKRYAKFVKEIDAPITPVNIYKFQGIEFWLMFDDMIGEPFISIERKYEYAPIKDLAVRCLNNVFKE
ncbi:MAG: hypothetical protein LIO53_02130 [Oscillospiraceae bacterium]|nr:hypothetical protein [Oscillospiraceae bacterium]